MPRLPIPGSDDNVWGNLLNAFLNVEHNPDGTLKLRTDGTLSSFYAKPNTGIPITDLAVSLQNTINQTVTSVNGRTGAVNLSSTDVGLSNVNNTSDSNKPVSTAQETEIIAMAIAL